MKGRGFIAPFHLYLIWITFLKDMIQSLQRFFFSLLTTFSRCFPPREGGVCQLRRQDHYRDRSWQQFTMSLILFSQGTYVHVSCFTPPLPPSLSICLAVSLSLSLSLSLFLSLSLPHLFYVFFADTKVCLKTGLSSLKFGQAMSTGLEVNSNWQPMLSSTHSTFLPMVIHSLHISVTCACTCVYIEFFFP